MRRSRSAVTAVLVCVTGLISMASPAGACPSSSVRIGGTDRIGTAVALSQASFANAGDAKGAVLATAADFPDALAGAPLAVAVTGPLLLTGPSSLDDRVSQELSRAVAQGSTIWLLGGTAALSAAVEGQIQSKGFTVRRVAGGDRYATAVAVARELPTPTPALGSDGRRVAYLATGRNFPDAVVAGAVAAGHPGAVVLSDDTRLPQVTADYLATVDVVYAFGDQAAAAYPKGTPIAGSDRYATSFAAAQRFFGNTSEPPGGPGNVPQGIAVATGASFPDALAGGPFLGRTGRGPILLARPDRLDDNALGYIDQHSGSLTIAAILGGDIAVRPSIKVQVDDVLLRRCGF